MKNNLAKDIPRQQRGPSVTPLTSPRNKPHQDPTETAASGRRRKSVQERLKARIEDRPSGCWERTGYRDRNGYGRIKINGRKVQAHRAAFEAFVGPIPDWADDLDHTCGNRGCIKPEHLQPVTHRENMRRTRRDHCPNGHRYTPRNTRTDTSGRRHCRTCERDRAKRARGRRSGGDFPGTPADHSVLPFYDHVGRLESLWEHKLRQLKIRVLPWTDASRAIVKTRLLRELGPESERVLTAVLDDWEGFTRYAVECFGGYKPTKLPTIRYLIARENLDAALNWLEERERREREEQREEQERARRLEESERRQDEQRQLRLRAAEEQERELEAERRRLVAEGHLESFARECREFSVAWDPAIDGPWFLCQQARVNLGLPRLTREQFEQQMLGERES